MMLNLLSVQAEALLFTADALKTASLQQERN
jgi:hypothetical protein